MFKRDKEAYKKHLGTQSIDTLKKLENVFVQTRQTEKLELTIVELTRRGERPSRAGRARLHLAFEGME